MSAGPGARVERSSPGAAPSALTRRVLVDGLRKAQADAQVLSFLESRLPERVDADALEPLARDYRAALGVELPEQSQALLERVRAQLSGAAKRPEPIPVSRISLREQRASGVPAFSGELAPRHVRQAALSTGTAWRQESTFVSSFPLVQSPDGALLFRARATGKLTAHRTADGEPVWSIQAGPALTTTPAVSADGQLLFTVSSDGNDRVLRAFRVASGEEHWSRPVAPQPVVRSPDVGASLVVVPGQDQVLVLDRDGGLFAHRAHDGAPQWTLADEELERAPGFPTFVVSDDGRSGAGLLTHERASLAEEKRVTLAGVDLRSGQVTWRHPPSSRREEELRIQGTDGQRLFVTCTDEESPSFATELRALDLKTGELLWKADVDLFDRFEPLSDGRRLVVFGSERAQVLDVRDGVRLSDVPYPEPELNVATPPLVVEGPQPRIVFERRRGELRVLSLGSGEVETLSPKPVLRGPAQSYLSLSRDGHWLYAERGSATEPGALEALPLPPAR